VIQFRFDDASFGSRFSAEPVSIIQLTVVLRVIILRKLKAFVPKIPMGPFALEIQSSFRFFSRILAGMNTPEGFAVRLLEPVHNLQELERRLIRHMGGRVANANGPFEQFTLIPA
jgi:hypothetical protein